MLKSNLFIFYYFASQHFAGWPTKVVNQTNIYLDI